MKYIKLGDSQLYVSRICMGCMGFGDATKGQHSWVLDKNQSQEIIAKGLELGVNFFDTAAGYQGGTSEQYLGAAINSLTSRDKVVLATKFYPRSEQQIADGISTQQHIENLLNQSLKNLATDYVDLYIYHMWDYNTPIYEIMEVLNSQVKAGKVRYIGISNCYAWQLAKANAIAEAEGFSKFVSMQGHYNLLFREEEREMTPYCKEENIALTPYSALAGGRLSKLTTEVTKRMQQDAYAKSKYDKTAQQDKIIIDRVSELATAKNCSMTEISLAWLLTKVHSPVVGATKISHIEGAAKATDLVLSQAECHYLEEMYVTHELVGIMAQKPQAFSF